MRDATPQPVLLSEYSEPHHWVEEVHLTFTLNPKATRVLSRIVFRANLDNPGPLTLEGEKLTLLRARIDGAEVAPTVSDSGLTLDVATARFTWECEVEIAPEDNTALEGLYMSKGMYCTQCEAEGFRKITYYPDRPDVMAPFTVRIEGDAPVMLSNGNPTGTGEHFAEWHDPWPKPAYLFALVAGDLVAHEDKFTTQTGRDVALKIWVRPGDEDRCAYAMDALKRSMRWDETEYGREYDLDLFQIVAVDDFNMGAMENKGLNIFNSKYVLASPETATDRDYSLIEGIIAHEYFHNWTGNRITCRDWFQLCLKEGLTVYRDQQFSGDMRSHAVQRIEDVLQLRARQFREDAGPLAHPVRPEEYIEINNFYTATVYEKGAEVIGMLRTLIGPEDYRKGCDLYFERHDGQACTIENWLKVFEDATGRDLTQFQRWYSQPGTPRLTVDETWEGDTLTLNFEQTNPKATGNSPQVIPIAVGLLDDSGAEIRPTEVLEMTDAAQSFSFNGLINRPKASILRGFSAPVILNRPLSVADRAFYLAHDTDPFNRFEAGRSLAKEVLLATLIRNQPTPKAFLTAMARMVIDDSLDPAFRALALHLPSEDDLARALFDAGHTPDPQAIHDARKSLNKEIAATATETLDRLYNQMKVKGPFTPDAEAAGKRSLRAACLSLLSKIEGPERARIQFARADNMTESLSALSTLLPLGAGKKALETFESRWSDDPNVMDKWFALQVVHAEPERAVATVKALSEHPAFTWKTPNRFRAVLGSLPLNQAGFHHASRDAYVLYTDWMLKYDTINPQTAARLAGAFETWRLYDTDRQDRIAAQLDRILATAGLSRDMSEMISRIRSG